MEIIVEAILIATAPSTKNLVKNAIRKCISQEGKSWFVGMNAYICLDASPVLRKRS